MRTSYSPNAPRFVTLSHFALGLGATGIGCSSALGQVLLEPWHDFEADRVVRDYVAADFDADELTDVALFNGNLWIYFNNGDGTFEPVDLGIDGWLADGLHAEDMDRDGNVDLVWSDHAPSLIVYFNSGDGRNGRLEIFPLDNHVLHNLEVADLDGDGYPEVIGSAGEGRHVGTATIYVMSNRFGEFEETQAISVGVSDVLACQAGDLDGDGDLDIATLTASWYDYYGYLKLNYTQVAVLTNVGSRRLLFSHDINLPYGGGEDEAPMGLAAGDMDGDSDLDLVISTYYDHPEVRILENIENFGDFTVHPAIPIGSWVPTSSWVSVADLDGDGRLDIVFSSAPNEEYWTLQNDGDFSFTLTEYPLNRAAAGLPRLADLTGDGRYDVLVGEYFGIEFARNISPSNGLLLEHAPLRRGQRVELTATGARPGDRVYFLGSVHGTGNSLGASQLGGMTLDLRSPVVQLANAPADENGTARAHFKVPALAPLKPVALQAVIRRGPEGRNSVKTAFREARIRE